MGRFGVKNEEKAPTRDERVLAAGTPFGGKLLLVQVRR